jgi:iron complex outermembrane receptor protein
MANIKARIGFVAATMLAASGVAGIAGAQEGAVALEEIVVTARRVEERLQDVPLAITAFSAAEIQSAGIENLDDVANLTPGLTFSSLLGEFLPVPVVRGIAPTAVQDRENNAAIFVDGVYISGREGLNFSQLDLERIEVVKGPQAAMYGRNSFSGAINFVTARPTDEFRGKAELTFGDNGRITASGSISGPLVEDKLRARVAIILNQWDGSYENQVPDGPDIGGFEYETLQGSLYWTPTDAFEAVLSLYSSTDKIDVSAVSSVTMNCENTSARGERLANFCGELPSVGKSDLSILAGATGEERDVDRANLTLKLNTELGEFTALSGFSSVEQTFLYDGSRGSESTTFAYQSSISPFPRAYVLGTFEAELLQIGAPDRTEEFSQELRFTSPEDRSLRYTLGAYFYSVEKEEGNSGVAARTPVPRGFANFCPCIQFFPGVGFALPAYRGTSVGDTAFRSWFSGPRGNATGAVDQMLETDAWSVFGAIDRDFSQQLTGRVELRYTDEEKHSQDFESGSDLNNSWDFISWRATLDYKPSENTMYYASIAGATKSGAFDFDTEDNVNGESVSVVSYIDPEENTSFELGTKGTYLGGRLSTDIAVFYIDWTEIVIPQLFNVDPNGVALAQPLGLDTNAGDASVLGLEASFAYAFTDNLTGNLGFSLTNSEFDEAQIESFADFPSFAPDGDVGGNSLLRQSEVQANATINYRRALRGNTDWYVRTDVMYTGKQWIGAPNQAEVPAHTYVNLRVGIDAERYSVELWSENLLDDDSPVAGFRDVYFGNALPGGGAGGFFDTFFPWRITLSHPRGRQVGVTARFRF